MQVIDFADKKIVAPNLLLIICYQQKIESSHEKITIS